MLAADKIGFNVEITDDIQEGSELLNLSDKKIITKSTLRRIESSELPIKLP